MSFWTRLFGVPPPPADSPGDPNEGLEYDATETFSRSLPFPAPSAWNGWPADWGIGWNNPAIGLRKLIDVAWSCIDTNSRVLSSFPVYRTRSETIIPPVPWMINPDETIYNSWAEFAKQLFWDYLLGEAFVLCMSYGLDGKPATMRVIPPWCVNAEMVGGIRRYNIGSMDCTDDILHLRYTSTTDDPRGHGPLEVAGARMTTAGVLQKYAQTLAETGGVPHYWIGVKNWLSPDEANELLDGWVESRKRHVGEPGVISGEGILHQTNTMSAKELALLELAQFSESRIAVLLGVPPFLVGLPSGGDSMCVDLETEILTRRGWKSQAELIIGEDVLTLNHDTGLSEWQPLQDVNRFIVKDRDMISIEMQGHSSFSTDDHKWPVVFTSDKNSSQQRILRMSRDLKRTDALITAAMSADVPTEPKYRDELVELVAWFCTEGCVLPVNTSLPISQDNATVGIAQSDRVNPEHVQRIRASLTRLFGNQWSEYRSGDMVSWRLKREAGVEILAVMEDSTKAKVVSREFLYLLTQSQLESFIRVSIWADGCESNGQMTFKQKNIDRLERFELACVLAGFATMRHAREDGAEVTMRRRGDLRPAQADRRARRFGREIIQHQRFDGVVWCPTTPNGTWFARRRGTTYFTHNTYSNVSSLFDYHDRSMLKPVANAVMQAMSNWATVRGQSVELNRDEYTRPAFTERANAWAVLHKEGIVSGDFIRKAERFDDNGETEAAAQLTGATDQPGLPQAQDNSAAPVGGNENNGYSG